MTDLEALRRHQEVVKIASNEYGVKYYYMNNFISWYNLGFLKDLPEINTMYDLASHAILDYDKCDYSQFECRYKVFMRLQYIVYCNVKGVSLEGNATK